MQTLCSNSGAIDSGGMRFRILLWSIFLLYMGRSVGKIIDKQYREPEGKPKLVRIKENLKWLFHFEYFFGPEVVKEGLITEILGYLFSALVLCLFIIPVSLDVGQILAPVSDWLVVLYAFLEIIIVTPMGIRYSRNVQRAYDSDWITQFQEAFTLLPKRRCKVVSLVREGVYEITLGHVGRQRHLAKSSSMVSVGSKMYAVHSNEQGSPFWTIRDH